MKTTLSFLLSLFGFHRTPEHHFFLSSLTFRLSSTSCTPLFPFLSHFSAFINLLYTTFSFPLSLFGFHQSPVHHFFLSSLTFRLSSTSCTPLFPFLSHFSAFINLLYTTFRLSCALSMFDLKNQ